MRRQPTQFSIGYRKMIVCSHGASRDGDLLAAVSHGEFDAASALFDCGAVLTLPVDRAITSLIAGSSALERHQALASQLGHTSIVLELLESDEDPNRYNPPGLHSHSTPLHQAVWRGSLETVQVLVSRGARLDLRDTLFDGTPLDWAVYGNRDEVAEWLRERN